MKYADLLQPAEPLESVKQIRESDTLESAKRDVETFVISDRMADQLTNIIIPALRFDGSGETKKKGVFVVATYGTGKTHLMSVIGGVAEHEALRASLQHPGVAEAAEPIAGRFKVIRFDIGATSLALREIVAAEIQRGLADLGVDFTFPDWSTVTNSKDAFADMMAAFEAVHPDHGLLFILDELLDYLRGRRDGELVHDLAFLREIGEIAASTRFRLIAGLQEAIFDNPRFAGVADTIRRVRDRFEQVRIAKEDVAFVVERRLLKKDATQRAKIAEHLQAFAPLYEGMAERIDEFVSLFPVHPDYLRTFNDMRMIEKREVLRTVEREVTALRDTEVPTDHAGLICADSYRTRLADDPSARTIPEVQLVLDKSDVLRAKVASALPEKQYVETALRIIDGLTIHRLTTDDVNRPIGMTAEMLRDELCLLPPGLPERDALFLKTTVDSIVRKILTAVSGQFISIDEENGQIYLDVTKDIDYDQQIEQRAESLDEHELDRAYYLAMEQVLGVSDDPYVAGYRIWQYDLPWATTNADRRGYLFMGAPNERSTAQPPRDFYIYFIQPYDEPRFTDEERADEVFIRLAKPSEEFTTALRRYAGATAKAKESTATHRPVYEDKSRRALQEMVAWLRSNMATAMTVTYRGETKPLGTWLATVPGERSKVQEQIDAVASTALADHFAAPLPGLPAVLAADHALDARGRRPGRAHADREPPTDRGRHRDPRGPGAPGPERHRPAARRHLRRRPRRRARCRRRQGREPQRPAQAARPRRARLGSLAPGAGLARGRRRRALPAGQARDQHRRSAHRRARARPPDPLRARPARRLRPSRPAEDAAGHPAPVGRRHPRHRRWRGEGHRRRREARRRGRHQDQRPPSPHRRRTPRRRRSGRALGRAAVRPRRRARPTPGAPQGRSSATSRSATRPASSTASTSTTPPSPRRRREGRARHRSRTCSRPATS